MKIKYFVVLSVSSFQKFLEEMRNHIHGELSEWSKVQHSKCCVPKRNLGFESLTLRQRRHKLCIACDDFFVKNHPALTPLFLLFPKKSVDFSGTPLSENRGFPDFSFLLFCSKSAQNYGKNSSIFGKNKAIFGISAYSNRKNQFFPPSSEISPHLPAKSTDSGSTIPLTIAFADDSFEV